MPPRHRAIAFVEARAVAADGAATTTRWTGGDDGSIVRWETKTGDADPGEPVVPVAFLGGHSGRVTALAVSEEDGLLLSGDDDGDGNHGARRGLGKDLASRDACVRARVPRAHHAVVVPAQ